MAIVMFVCTNAQAKGVVGHAPPSCRSVLMVTNKFFLSVLNDVYCLNGALV